MRSFKDINGKDWEIAHTVTSAKRVRDLLGLDLLQPEAGEPPNITRLGTDEILLCDVIYVLCKNQADERGISDEDFGKGLGGAAILAAQTALYEELIDFFRLRGRQDRAAAVQKQQAFLSSLIETATRQVEALDLDTALKQVRFGETSTRLPEPSVLIQDRSPLEN